MNNTTNYTEQFQTLILAGVPRSFIRLFAIENLICVNSLQIYHNDNIKVRDGWYTVADNGIDWYAVDNNDMDKSFGEHQSYGKLENLGLPSLDEYFLLFDGNEYDEHAEYVFEYEHNRQRWDQKRIFGHPLKEW